MQPQPKNARLNVQIPFEVKLKLAELSAFQGKKVSVMVRESIEEKLKNIETEMFEEKMKCAYEALAKENIEISEDFKYVDSENL